MRPFAAHLVLLLCLAFGPLSAQGEHPAFRRFGLTQGLPQSQVTTLLEDRHGFLWVGTFSGGVARLGASGFRVFSAAEGLQVRSVGSLLEDRDGHIWVAGRDGGLSEIAGERILNHGVQTGIPEPRLYALALDREGRVLVGSAHGLYRREGSRFVPIPLAGEWSKLPLFRLALDAHGSLWAFSRKGRIIRWDGASLQEEKLPTSPGVEVEDLQADPQGRIWALTETTLYLRAAEGWVAQPLPGLPNPPKLASLAFSPEGEPVLALGSDGVWLREGGQVKVFTQRDGLPRDVISAVLWDRHGGLWVGSDGDGLAVRLVPGLWTFGSGDGPGGADIGAVMSFAELGGGKLLLATNHGLCLFEEGKGILRRWNRAEGLRSESLWCLLPAHPSGVWVGSDRGVQLWRDGRLLPGPKALDQIAVTELVRFQGRIYAATDKGVAIFEESGAFVRMCGVPPEVGPSAVSQILPHGNELIIGGFAGVLHLQGDRAVPMAPPELARLMAGGLMEDRNGSLWIASTSGLVRVDGQRLTRTGTANGLLDENLTWAADLSEGTLAVGHGHGVSFLTSEGIHHLTRNLGLLSDETNQNGVLRDAKGRLWIGMIGGFNRLDAPLRFRNTPMRPPVVLEARWPGGAITLPSSLDLPPLPEVLELRFDLGQPGLPAAPRYQALLEGVDSEWRDVSPGNALQYLHLGKGHRNFRLRATIDGLRWVEAQPLPLEVRPAWHERWSVRVLILLALAGAVGLLVRWRLHRLAQAAEELEAMVEDRTHMLDRQYKALAQAHEQIKRSLEARIRLVDMVTHDLRSPLTSIALAADRLREEDDPEVKLHMIGLLDQECRRIDDLVRGLLDRSRSEAALQSLRPLPTTPSEVLEGIQEVLRLKAETKGLQFHLDIPGDQAHAKVLVDATALRQAILNLFENAVKFTPAGGQVGLRSRMDLATLEWVLAVWDTGRGIPLARQAEILQPFAQVHLDDAGQGWGLGLSIVQSLIEAHGGSLGLESEEGQGATFYIALPLLEH